jgi:hypothetical protein
MMLNSGHFVLVSCECKGTSRAEQALGQFQARLLRIPAGTLEGELLCEKAAESAYFHSGRKGFMPNLILIDDDLGGILWEGGNPSELEILNAVYLAGDFV